LTTRTPAGKFNIRDYARGVWGDAARVEVAASLPLPLLLAQQAKANSRFKRKQSAGGHSVPACGDLGGGRSAKQERLVATQGSLGL